MVPGMAIINISHDSEKNYCPKEILTKAIRGEEMKQCEIQKKKRQN